MDGVTSDHRKFHRGVSKFFRAIDALPIFLMDMDSIRLAGVEFPDLGFEIEKMAFRPLDLGAGSGLWYWVRGCHVEESEPGFMWEPNVV